MLFGGHVKVKEILYIQLIIWIDTILNHIETRTILPKVWKSLLYIHEWHENKHVVEQSYPTCIMIYEILIIDTK